jgi:uncharacterized membrane protein
MSEADLWLGVLWMHLVAMAFFVGGQIVVGATVVPVERSAPDHARLIAIARRFGYGSLVALVVLLATGSALASHYDLWGESVLHLKLGAVGLAIALTLLHLRFPRAHALQAAILVVSLAIVWLGLDLSR